MHVAAHVGDTDCLETLIPPSHDTAVSLLNMADDEGRTAAHLAASRTEKVKNEGLKETIHVPQSAQEGCMCEKGTELKAANTTLLC